MSSCICFQHADRLLEGCDPRTHVVGTLETGNEALLVRTHLLRNARQTIDVQTFIWANDECGRFIVRELLEAAKRGVKIRVIVDGWVILGNPQLISFLSVAHENIQVKHYNPPAERIVPSKLDLVATAFTDFSVINHRMHNKAFIVDRTSAIVGGRNYQNDYFDRSTGRNFLDREMIVFGPAVRDVTSAFEVFWESKRAIKGELLKDFADHTENNPYGSDESFELGTIFDSLNDLVSDEQQMSEYFQETFSTATDVCYVTDLPQHYDDDLNPTVRAMVDYFAGADEHLLLQTPYLVLDPVHFEVLQRLRKDRPLFRLRVLTNSLASTDNVLAFAHSFRERVRYLSELMMQIHELKPVPADVKRLLGFHRSLSALPPAAFARALELRDESAVPFSLCCHAKTFVRDCRSVWIGSSNIDPRSARVNSENAFIVFDERFARRIAANIEKAVEPQNSWTTGLSRGSQPIAENFEPLGGAPVVPFYHPAFYDHYQSVGEFPAVTGTAPEIQVRLISFLPEVTKALV